MANKISAPLCVIYKYSLIIMRNLIFVLFLFSNIAYGQQIARVENMKINSKELNQEREILIYTPANYDEDLYVFYDVIYVFDSQSRELFDFTHSSLSFIDNNENKHFIVVGITSPGNESLDYYRNNDMLPVPINVDSIFFYNGYCGNADNFLKYVSKEVVPYIQKNYRINSNRISVGHSLSASLILYSFLKNSSLFDAYIAISPNLSYDGNRLADELIKYDYKDLKANKYIYLSNADEGNNYRSEWKPAREKVYDFINKSTGKENIKFVIDSFPQCNHWTTFAPSLTSGLTKYIAYSENQKSKLSKETYKIMITVTVPSKNDKVYITGNQTNLGNWNLKKVKLTKTSDFERTIQLEVKSPAVFKFTRGMWESEAIVKHNDGMGNITIKPKEKSNYRFEIINWIDKE